PPHSRRKKRSDLVEAHLPTGQIHIIFPSTHRAGSSSLRSFAEDEVHSASDAQLPTSGWATKTCKCLDCVGKALWFQSFSTPDDAIEEAISNHLDTVKSLEASERQWLSSVEAYEIASDKVVKLAQYFKQADMPSHYDNLKERIWAVGAAELALDPEPPFSPPPSPSVFS
ncbi:hypothetical protein FA13DRAFT_1806813, partial [Coprinellus micaceus]